MSTEYFFEKCVLPDVLRFVHFSAVSRALDESYMYGYPPSTIEDFIKIAYDACMSGYYDQGYKYNDGMVSGTDLLNKEELDFLYDEVNHRVDWLVGRYIKENEIILGK